MTKATNKRMQKTMKSTIYPPAERGLYAGCPIPESHVDSRVGSRYCWPDTPKAAGPTAGGQCPGIMPQSITRVMPITMRLVLHAITFHKREVACSPTRKHK